MIVSDSNDILLLKHKNVMIQRFLGIGRRVVMAAESLCVNGIYLDALKRKEMNTRMEQVMGKEEYAKTRYKYGNGGFIMGYAADVLQLLVDNKDAKDDQNGYLAIWLADPSRYALDNDTLLCGNISMQVTI